MIVEKKCICFWKIIFNTSLAAKGALAHRLQRHTAYNAAPPAKSKMAARVPQNGQQGLSPGFWAF